MSLAIRALGDGEADGRPDPAAVLKIVERVMSEGNVRSGEAQHDLGPEDALALLRSWLAAMNLEVDERKLIAAPAGRRHRPPGPLPPRPPDPRARARARRRTTPMAVIEEGRLPGLRTRPPRELFDACIPAIPYAAATAFLGREKLKLTRNDGDRPRVALVADGLGGDARRDPHDPADPRPRRARASRSR